MKKQLTITDVEQQIDQCIRLLSVPQSMAIWSKIISLYNAQKIKQCQMKGERPIVTEGKKEHII